MSKIEDGFKIMRNQIIRNKKPASHKPDSVPPTGG